MMRIKDPKQRVAVEALFGEIRAVPNWMPKSAELHLVFPGHEKPALVTGIELEPVPDNAPWHEYHGEALKPRRAYLVVYEDICGVNYGVIPADSQGHLHEDVLAWLDIPVWRE